MEHGQMAQLKKIETRPRPTCRVQNGHGMLYLYGEVKIGVYYFMATSEAPQHARAGRQVTQR
jgi:hypothetical protein